MSNFRTLKDCELRTLSDSELNLVSGGGAISDMMGAAKCVAAAVEVVQYLHNITPCCGDVRVTNSNGYL
jgi:hypothetical protein